MEAPATNARVAPSMRTSGTKTPMVPTVEMPTMAVFAPTVMSESARIRVAPREPSVAFVA